MSATAGLALAQESVLSMLREQPRYHVKVNVTSPDTQIHVTSDLAWVFVEFELVYLKISLCIYCLWFPKGAKKEGAAGFFKGIGKGLVGAVARPTGGIIDMASSTFQGIQR